LAGLPIINGIEGCAMTASTAPSKTKSMNPRQDPYGKVIAVGVNLTPSKSPYSLLAQRDVRGVLLIIAIVLVFMTIGLSVLLFERTRGRTARISPSVERVSAAVGLREVADMDAISAAVSFAMAAETFEKSTLNESVLALRPMVHPSFYPRVSEELTKRIDQSLPEFGRVGKPIAWKVFGRNQGIVTVIVYMHIREHITNRNRISDDSKEPTIIIGDTVERVAMVNVVPQSKTDENPIGVGIYGYVVGTVADYTSNGGYAFWTHEAK
jgi:hypothetical protein